MKYTLQSSALALLMCLSFTVAFVPTGPRAWGIHDTKLNAADESKPDTELKLDTDFENINITRLLGRRRVSKFVKKKQSIATAAAAREAKGSDAAPVAASTPAKKAGLKIIIAGAPASGKGTQCESIKKEYGVVHLSTGDMLRAAVAAGTDVGKKAKEFMDAGMLVPDEVIIGVVSLECCV